MKRAFTFIDRPKSHFKQGVSKIYKNREGDVLNTVSTSAPTVTIKQRRTSRVVGNDDNVDPAKLRNGVEIVDPIFRMRGVVDISYGNDTHIHDQLTIGQSWTNEDDDYFSDNQQQLMSKISELHSGSGNHTISLNFYKVRIVNSSSLKFRETAKNIYNTQMVSNGAIQIFDGNSYFSSTVDERDTSVRKGAPNRIIKQTIISSQYPNKLSSMLPFIDQSPTGGITTYKPLEGTNIITGSYALFDINTKLKTLSIKDSSILMYKNWPISRQTFYAEQESQEFFDDSTIVHKTSRLSDNMNNTMANTMLIMSGTGVTDDYISDNMKSAPTGFMFDDATFGTDSIAFR
ncbi:hypothetical protein CL622_09165 [archaeon]|nr:hypothetical protein [archaeon]